MAGMPTFVSELDPALLWKQFDRILSIPRASKNEEGMRAFVREIAASRGLPVSADAAGNLVMRKNATS